MLKYLILTILFQIIAAGCPSGCMQYNQQCLCFHASPESFEVAKTNCIKDGGQLADIPDLKTNQWVFQQAILNNLHNDLWITVTPQQHSQRFFKLSQKTAEYSKWNLQQKHVFQNSEASKICGAMSLLNGGKWFTESCNTQKPYICSITTVPESEVDDTPTTQAPVETTTDGCIDQIASCQQYLNECSDPDYQPMLYKFCRKTCNLCSQCMDSDPQCPVMAASGFCTNPAYQDKWKDCAKTCKLC